MKRLDGKFNYQEAKEACAAESIDVAGNENLKIRGEIVDHKTNIQKADRTLLGSECQQDLQ